MKHDNHTILYDYAKQKQNYCSLDLTSLFHHTLGFMLLAYTGKCPQADPAKLTTDKTSSAVTTQFVPKLWILRRDIIKIETGIYVWLSYYKYDFRLCDSWKIRFQTRQFGHQWSCQNTCWVQLGHVSSALSALRPRAAKMAPILWSILSRQVQDNSDLSEIWLVWWQSLLISVGWSIINTSRTIFMLLVLWFDVFFIEKSSRESVEAISGLAVFDRFYQDSGRKSACVNDVQSPRAA